MENRNRRRIAPIRVLLADDHPLFLDGVKAALMGDPDLEVVGTAGDRATALDQAAALEPDVVLMDLNLPDGSGIDATRDLLAAQPSARVLVMTMSADDDAVVAAMRAGARGYVVKGAGRDDLLHAVRTVASGGAVFSAGVADRLGSIDKGKIANLVVTDGELFQEKTKIKYIFVDGAKYEPVPESAEEREVTR